MTLSGKDAWNLLHDIDARNQKQRAERLAHAKVDAAARGKEPFDLAKLETMADTSSEGRLDPPDVRQARFEEMYYVQFPSIMTVEEFARKVAELNKW